MKNKTCISRAVTLYCSPPKRDHAVIPLSPQKFITLSNPCVFKGLQVRNERDKFKGISIFLIYSYVWFELLLNWAMKLAKEVTIEDIHENPDYSNDRERSLGSPRVY
jgi:hypothetical protein